MTYYIVKHHTNMTTNAITKDEAVQAAQHLRFLLKTGQITYTECRQRIAPFIAVMDETAREIAKKYGKRHTPFSISAFLR